MFELFLSLLALTSAALLLWQWIAAVCFPLHESRPIPKDFTFPGVTVLKPLKGIQSGMEQCLESWLLQTYQGPLQILFGVVNPSDPVVEMVRQLLQKYPHVDAELLFCEKHLGMNAKVSTLMQLESAIKHPIVVISDADVRVVPQHIEQNMVCFGNPKVDLVHCFYQLGNPATLAMRWESICINADFWSQVLQARSLKPVDFALGATMAIRREALQGIGGLGGVKDFLADDYQLGHQIARAGGQIDFCQHVATCLEPAQGWSKIWKHQLRWARTIRVSQPLGFFGTLFCNATLWPVLLMIGVRQPWAVILGVTLILLRIWMAADLQARLTRSREGDAFGWLVPIKDLLQLALWMAAFLGNEVTWRGQRFRILRGGKLAGRQELVSENILEANNSVEEESVNR